MSDTQLEKTIRAATKYARTLVGCPFKWWIPGTEISPFDPFYTKAPMDQDYSKLYTKDYVKLHGVNSAGLINLVAHHIGVKPVGGSIMWMGKHVMDLQPFNSEKSYPNTTILIREYRSSNDQGHMALVVDDKKIIHAYPPSEIPTEYLVYPGVCVEDWDISNNWVDDGFYDYAILPENWIKQS